MSSLFALFADYLKWIRTYTPQESLKINADYLKFGSEEYPAFFDFEAVSELLQQMDATKVGNDVWTDSFANSNFCYFCHRNLMTIDYIVLRNEFGQKDRRVCKDCEKRLLSKKEDLLPLIEHTREYMSTVWGAELPKGIHVRLASAAAIRKQLTRNKKHKRVIGLAQRLTKTVWVETNSPKENLLSTLVHELTHIWQFENLDCKDIIALEGHSSYMEVVMLKHFGYNGLAQETDLNLRARINDEYGKGYIQLTEALANSSEKNPYKYMLAIYPKGHSSSKAE